MTKGRGPAEDSLPANEALAVRRLLRKARDVKGLGNTDLAEHLGWKRGQVAPEWPPEKVARVLDLTGGKGKTPRPLRASNAIAILRAINDAKPRVLLARWAIGTALLITNEALGKSRLLARYGRPEPTPQVLMWSDDEAIRAFAQFLSDRMPRQRRERLVDDLVKALKGGCRELAESAADVYVTQFSNQERQQRKRKLLRSFGY